MNYQETLNITKQYLLARITKNPKIQNKAKNPKKKPQMISLQ